MISFSWRPIGIVLSTSIVVLITACTSPSGEQRPGMFPRVTVAEDGDLAPPSFAAMGVVTQDATVQAFLDAIETAYVTNPSTRAAALRTLGRVEDARAEARFLRPSVSLTGDTLDEAVGVVATQPLFDFGARAARVAEIEAEAETERLRLAEDRGTLLREALFAILEADHARTLARIHREQVAEFTQARETAERLANLNLLTEADVRFAAVNVQQAQVRLSRARNDAAQADRAWAQATGSNTVPRGLSLSRILAAAGLDSRSLIECVTRSSNIDLLILAARTAEVEAELITLRRSNNPVINALARTTLTERGFDNAVGLSVDVTVFDRTATDRRQSVARNLEALQAAEAELERDLRFRLADLSAQAREARSLAAVQRESLTLLRARVEDLQGQLELGLASYTDVIEAQIEAFDTELAIAESRFTATRAEAEIVLLSGALVPSDSVTSACQGGSSP